MNQIESLGQSRSIARHAKLVLLTARWANAPWRHVQLSLSRFDLEESMRVQEEERLQLEEYASADVYGAEAGAANVERCNEFGI